MFLYSFPESGDFFKDQFVKTQIASGFKNAWSLTVPNMCPGFPYAIYPEVSNKSQRAHILIAGDGDYSAHLMRPNENSTAADAPLYTRELIKNLGGTVGSITFGDSDGDGWLEFYVPNYDKNYIEVYKFYDQDASAAIPSHSHQEELLKGFLAQ